MARIATPIADPQRAYRPARWLAAVIALLSLVAAPHAGPIVSHPWVGITYVDRTESAPRPVHVHVVQVDLNAPGIRFTLSPPAGPLETVRQTTREFLNAQRAQVAINAHFFLPWPSTQPDARLVGIGASDGRVFSSFETPEQAYAIVANAPGLNIDRRNRARLVHRDPAHLDGLHVLERVTLWNTVSGSAQIVTDGRPTVPAYEDGPHPGAPLKPGGPGQYTNEKSWYDAVNARTAIGLSRDARTLTLFTVDARGGSVGMRIGEVADMLIRDYLVWNALNLDGGGSSSLAMEDPVTHEATLVNASSDNPDGRQVGSSLAVFARPGR